MQTKNENEQYAAKAKSVRKSGQPIKKTVTFKYW